MADDSSDAPIRARPRTRVRRPSVATNGTGPRQRSRPVRTVRVDDGEADGTYTQELTDRLDDLGLTTHFPANYRDGVNVGDKARNMAVRLGSGAAEQYILTMVLRLQLRGANTVQMAQALNVTTRTITRYRALLNEALEAETRTRSPELYLGQLMAGFNEMIGTAMSEFQSTPASRTITRTNPDGSIDRFEEPDQRGMAYRSAMFGHALTGMSRVSQLLARAGVFDNTQAAKGGQTDHEAEARRLRRMTSDLMDPDIDVEALEVEVDIGDDKKRVEGLI